MASQVTMMGKLEELDAEMLARESDSMEKWV